MRRRRQTRTRHSCAVGSTCNAPALRGRGETSLRAAAAHAAISAHAEQQVVLLYYMRRSGGSEPSRGVRRLTDDVDATIWADGTDLDALLAALAEQAILPRIDLSLASLPFEDEALARASDVRLGDRGIPVASPDDLVVYKAIAARERDRSDVERLLELHGRTMALDRVRALVRQLSDALERPELLDDLEAWIRRVSARADRE